MYSKQDLHKQYQNIQVSTVDRGRLLLMMYDGGIKFLRHAKDGLESKDIVKFARFLSKGQAIIAELANTLDFEKGGMIARDLDRLYDFMMFYLTEANIQKSPQKVQKVIDLLETVANAYREVIEKKKYLEDPRFAEEAGQAPAGRVETKAPTAAATPEAKDVAGSEQLASSVGRSIRVSY